MALAARSLALRGEALFLIRDDGLVPVSDWDLSTRNGRPRAYRVSVSEAGGGRSETALAAAVLHLRIGSDPVAPWTGTAPLRRASLTAGMLHALELALAEVYELAPLGSSIVPFPESPETDNEALGRSFRGQRGRCCYVRASKSPPPVGRLLRPTGGLQASPRTFGPRWQSRRSRRPAGRSRSRSACSRAGSRRRRRGRWFGSASAIWRHGPCSRSPSCWPKRPRPSSGRRWRSTC
jgi:hypothetical protein